MCCAGLRLSDISGLFMRQDRLGPFSVQGKAKENLKHKELGISTTQVWPTRIDNVKQKKHLSPFMFLPPIKMWSIYTLPATNIAPENQWLEDEISFWDGLFSRAFAVSFRECIYSLDFLLCKAVHPSRVPLEARAVRLRFGPAFLGFVDQIFWGERGVQFVCQISCG